MVKAEYGIRVSESPGVRGLGETGDYVQGGEGEGWNGRSGFNGSWTSGMRRDYAGASRGGDWFHAATVFDTKDATGFIWTRSVNERLRVRLFLVVGDGDYGVPKGGSGGTQGFFGRVQREGRRGSGMGGC